MNLPYVPVIHHQCIGLLFKLQLTMPLHLHNANLVLNLIRVVLHARQSRLIVILTGFALQFVLCSVICSRVRVLRIYNKLLTRSDGHS